MSRRRTGHISAKRRKLTRRAAGANGGRHFVHVVKSRHGGIQPFDERKVYASVYAACYVTHMDETKAERICEKVTARIRRWIRGKRSVASTQIFNQVARELRKVDRNIAFMYETHKEID